MRPQRFDHRAASDDREVIAATPDAAAREGVVGIRTLGATPLLPYPTSWTDADFLNARHQCTTDGSVPEGMPPMPGGPNVSGSLQQLTLFLCSYDHDEDWLVDKSRTLLDWLRELDVESADRLRQSPAAAPPGAAVKSGGDLVAAAALVVTFVAGNPDVLTQLVQLLCDVVRRNRALEITIDGVLSVRADNLDRENTTALVQALVQHLEHVSDGSDEDEPDR
ncbi:hypothetical protein [Streptomyces collinus]|uniref:hypothetical protein n=1 Tax=Streptomyces collinus TaxID=42684 RepID=UPI00332DCAA9